MEKEKIANGELSIKCLVMGRSGETAIDAKEVNKCSSEPYARWSSTPMQSTATGASWHRFRWCQCRHSRRSRMSMLVMAGEWCGSPFRKKRTWVRHGHAGTHGMCHNNAGLKISRKILKLSSIAPPSCTLSNKSPVSGGPVWGRNSAGVGRSRLQRAGHNVLASLAPMEPMKRLRPWRWWERCQCQWELRCCDKAMTYAFGTGLLCSTDGHDGISEELMLSGNPMNNHKVFLDYHKNCLNNQGLSTRVGLETRSWPANSKDPRWTSWILPRRSSRPCWTFCCSSWWQAWQSRTWRSSKRIAWSSWCIWSSKMGLSWWSTADVKQSSQKNEGITSFQEPHGDRAGNPGHLGGERTSNRENLGGEVFGVRYGQGMWEPRKSSRWSAQQFWSGLWLSVSQVIRINEVVGIHEQIGSHYRGAQGRCDDGDGRDQCRQSRSPQDHALRSTNPTMPKLPTPHSKNASVEVTDWLAESTFDWGSVDKSFHMVGSHYAGEHAHLADMAGINTVGSWQPHNPTWNILGIHKKWGDWSGGQPLSFLVQSRRTSRATSLPKENCGHPQSCTRCFDATALVDGKSALDDREDGLWQVWQMLVLAVITCGEQSLLVAQWSHWVAFCSCPNNSARTHWPEWKTSAALRNCNKCCQLMVLHWCREPWALTKPLHAPVQVGRLRDDGSATKGEGKWILTGLKHARALSHSTNSLQVRVHLQALFSSK